MVNKNLNHIKKFFYNPKISFTILACFIALGIWQHTRSNLGATFIYISHMISDKVFHGQISGTDLTVRLDVPWHRQEHALSCEVAALKMALSAYGLDISESELIAGLPFTSMRGDPHEAFVGNIDGRMGVTGYGVYWDPIAKIGNAYLRSEVFQASPQLLAQHISEGRPVVSWGYFGRGNKLSWTTPGGREIVGINGEHARTVVGFSGDVNNPSGFVLLDPIYGEEYWETQDLFNNSSPFNHMSVVIYPHPKWVKTSNSTTIWEISSDAKIKYPLAMSWERFLEYGGIPDGVKIITEEELANMNSGFVIR